MVFSDEDKVLIKIVFVEKLRACKIDKWVPREKLEEEWIGEPPEKAGQDLRTEVSSVEELVLVLSQEGNPQTHRSIRQISREIGVPKSSVLRIVHDDLSLKCVKKRRAQELTQSNRAVRQQRAKELLQMFPDDKGRHQEEAGRGWASVAYANNVQSVGDGVGRCLKA